MGYGHKYYSDAERLKAVKGYMNAGMTASEYAKKLELIQELLEIGFALLEVLMEVLLTLPMPLKSQTN